MKIHILQHVHFEGPGYIAEWAEKNGHTLSYTKFFKAFTIPLPTDIDFLIVLGGTMSVNDTKQFPWLCDEKDYIYHLAKKGCRILGICLGGQLIASALGMDVYPNKTKEIGWFPIQKNPASKLDFIEKLPTELPAFHWHGDTFEIPGRASRIFSSEACTNQGFVIYNRVFALQFHWEVTRESVKQMIEFGGNDLEEDTWVQPVKKLLGTEENFTAINQHMEKLLDYISSL
ncbi:MAG: amidotransferase [Bacteroidetes bacterium]|nr:MAG: amidotransferase [Bacteroidota bacterium]